MGATLLRPRLRVVLRRQIFLTSDVFTPRVSDIEVFLVGGGGSGQPGSSSARGYGGQGGELKHRLLSMVVGQAYAVTIGAGGVSPAGASGSQNGVSGSASSIGALLTAIGGSGGGLTPTSNAADPLVGGPTVDASTDAHAALLAGIAVPGLDGVRLAGSGSKGYLGVNTTYQGGRGGVGGGGSGGGMGYPSGIPEARLIADVGALTYSAASTSNAAGYRGGDGVTNTGSGGGGGGANTTNGYYGTGGTGGSGLLIAQWLEAVA